MASHGGIGSPTYPYAGGAGASNYPYGGTSSYDSYPGGGAYSSYGRHPAPPYGGTSSYDSYPGGGAYSSYGRRPAPAAGGFYSSYERRPAVSAPKQVDPDIMEIRRDLGECMLCHTIGVPPVVLEPCGHICVCERCSNSLYGKSCPMPKCRRGVTGSHIRVEPLNTVAQALKAFRKADRDNSGSIDEVEVISCLRELDINPTPADIKRFMEKADTNRDGVIDFKEFCALCGIQISEDDAHRMIFGSAKPKVKPGADRSLESKLTDALMAFRVYDRDHSGFIDSSEVQMALQQQGVRASAADINRFMDRADANHDGRISFKEFCQVSGISVTDQAINQFLRDYGANRSSPAKNKAPSLESKLTDALMAFRVYDRDHSGFIDRSEVQMALQQQGVRASAADINRFMDRADANHDGRISFKEFCQVSGISVTDQAANKFLRDYGDREQSLKDALKAFRKVDRDNSGFIDVREVYTCLKESGISSNSANFTQLTNEFMRKADKNGDGQVSFKEFCEVVCGIEISEQAATKLIKDALKTSAPAPKGRPSAPSRPSPPSKPSPARSPAKTAPSLESKLTDALMAFRQFDRDHSGFIDSTEVLIALREQGSSATQADVNRFIARADQNHDGRISFFEFCSVAGVSATEQAVNVFEREYVERENSLKEALKAFRVVDADNSGYIDGREVYMSLRTLGLPDGSADMNTLTNEFMRKADKNGDGQVSFKEFVEVVCGMEISEQAAEKLVKSKV